MEKDDFAAWQSGNVSGQTPVEQGRDLFENKLGCASCHAGGPQQRGAKLEGIYGKDIKLVGGQTVKVDDEYIRNSILNPSGQIVDGYSPIMPTFKGQVTEEQLVSLVAYIKSLSGVTGSTAPGAAAGTSPATNTASNSTVAPRADRGNSNTQGSNPNAPGTRPEPANSNR
jgi:cytochrome c oxidase subunit 2